MKMIIFLGLVFLMSGQPMSLVMSMMVIVFIYSVEMFKDFGTFWYSIVLMLVMLSGVMVIFSYMVSMSPNESFELVIVGMVVMVLIVVEFVMKWGWSGSFMSLELWNKYIMVVNEFMVGFLLVIMVMTIWLSGWWSGPIRV